MGAGGGGTPHPAASRPRRHADTDSTRGTRAVTQRHTRAHAGTPGWGVSARALCPCSPRPLSVGMSRCGCRHVWRTCLEGWSWLDAGLCNQDLGVSRGRGDQPGSYRAHAMHARVHLHTRAQVCLHTHSHPAPSLRSWPARSRARMCQSGRRGGKFGGKQRDTRKEATTGPTNERATDSIPSNRQWQLLRWLRQPLGKVTGSGGSRGNTARGRAASAVLGTLIKSEPGQRRSN